MRAQMLELMRLMANAILADELAAGSLMDDAECMQAHGLPEVADMFRTTARHHRVRVLELQGRLAAMHQEYAARLHDEPRTGP